jgi:hypothetical protein
MNEKEWIKLINYVDNTAARYKKKYYQKEMKEQYGGTPDWLELTNAGIDAIDKNDSFDDAKNKVKNGIDAKYRQWRYNEYYEPMSLTAKITKGSEGIEYKEFEVSDENRIQEQYRVCLICGIRLDNSQQKTCSESCKKKLKYLRKKA